MNVVSIVGNIVRIDSKNVNGKTLVEFDLALYRDKDNSDFVSCKAWEKTGELVSKYHSKGDKIGIVGKLRQETWKDSEGKSKSRLTVSVDNVSFVKGKSSSGSEFDY